MPPRQRTEFHGPNAAYLAALLERFLEDPATVDPATRAYFERLGDRQLREIAGGFVDEDPAPTGDSRSGASDAERSAPPGRTPADVAAAAAALATAVREHGHLAARVDPLRADGRDDDILDPSYHGLTADDLRALPPAVVGGPVAAEARDAGEALERLREIYCGPIGYDLDLRRQPDERDWLRDAAESGRFRSPADPVDQVALLERLTSVEALEVFLGRTFPGATRFSIEGLDALVPVLDELQAGAAESGVCTVVLGMAHRGRLNVLAHVLGKPYARILAEMRDPTGVFDVDAGYTGDVTYHKGARRAVTGGEQVRLLVTMLPNPSHLEAVGPVVIGTARALQAATDRAGPPRLFLDACLAVLVHGDASFPAQGIVAETLNLSRLAGYRVGGTVHVIANNGIGFTTNPEDARSTRYASDLAHGFRAPVVHVNADEPLACIEAARLALAYRQRFRKDFVIDLVGYRRHGHNEGDEPRITQPLLYRRIESHPTVRHLLAERLVAEGAVAEAAPGQMLQARLDELAASLAALEPERDAAEAPPPPPPAGAARRVETKVDLARLREVSADLWTLPEGFAPARAVARALERRRRALEDPASATVEWATAEHLALATILADGVAVRLTGQDTARGTFGQRHAVLHDAETGARDVPLARLAAARAAFEVIDSPLSEAAALGFEYGYSIAAPRRLVIWEAQYGDFVNGAQTVVDGFLASGRAKWGHEPSLVLLLPHGHEGQGPDHSNAWPQRFLQLADGGNLRIANVTTAAQLFHVLRRQALLLETDPLPLVLLTPKGLLRHPRTASPGSALAEGRFRPVLDDPDPPGGRDDVRRVLLCSGRVFVDLADSPRRTECPEVAVLRLEQLHPFPADALGKALAAYRQLESVVWTQEEPENMGAWAYVRPHLEDLGAGRWPVRYVGRPASASAAEGSTAWHKANQAALVAQAFEPDVPVPGAGMAWLERI